jgi:predicted AAA+ superfamily ATPase
MIIPRKIESDLLDRLNSNNDQRKIIIIYGARQVGKTTLIKQVLKSIDKRTAYFNCDYLDVQSAFAWENAGNLSGLVSNLDILVLDEAQRIRNIGLVLKILHDDFPNLRVIASGSSSFDLSNQVNEPLTGRKFTYALFPLSFTETHPDGNMIDDKRNLSRILRFGLYPSVILHDDQKALENLQEITSSYLFKDILEFQYLRKPEVLVSLLKMLAFQVGSEVSYTELSVKLRTDQTVIQRYIQLLEDNFVIFRLPALKRNLRSEITKSRKIYFWDIGIRNAIIGQFQSIDTRNDLGALWENFCISERFKYLLYNRFPSGNLYFWRTYAQKEIDLIEECQDGFKAFEFKWNSNKISKLPSDFSNNYAVLGYETITPANFREKLFRD